MDTGTNRYRNLINLFDIFNSIVFDPSQPSLDFWFWIKPISSFFSKKDIIIDRKSRYWASYQEIHSKQEIDEFLQKLKSDDYFKKATHNSYAFRIKESSWAILEWKNDDGETGAGMCILREMQRADMVDSIVVITRIFWGIHLQADRFKNVINATKNLIERIKE